MSAAFQQWPTRPDVVNGIPVLAASRSNRGVRTPGTRAGWVILLRREHDLHPFITAVLFEGDAEWSWGHYLTNAREAYADFDARVERGC